MTSPIPTPEPHLSVHLSQNYGEPLQCDVKIDGRKVFSGVTWEALTPAVKVPPVSSERSEGPTLHDLDDVAAEFGVDLDEPDDRCPHDIYDRGDGTVSECSLPKGHAPTAHDSGDGVMWTDGEHWKDEESNLDDLPGEPVEPGDLKAGDRVGFTYRGERITGNLVVSGYSNSVLRSDAPNSGGYTPRIAYRRKWGSGISDVRLIERAPQEGEDPDEALAMDLYHASLGLPPASEIGPSAYGDSSVRERFLEMARDTRKMEVIGKAIEQAEAERDALRERLDSFRADAARKDYERTPAERAFGEWLIARDDERAAKGEQR